MSRKSNTRKSGNNNGKENWSRNRSVISVKKIGKKKKSVEKTGWKNRPWKSIKIGQEICQLYQSRKSEKNRFRKLFGNIDQENR